MFASTKTLASRICGLFAGRKADQDFEEELSAHLEMLTQENIRRGMVPEEAQRAARIRLGGFTQLKETNRDLRGLPIIETFFRDCRYALRTLRKSPAFASVAILTLALGIGANVAIFSIVNAVLLRPFAFRNAEKLVWIYSQSPDRPRLPFSLPEFCDYRDQATLFHGLSAVGSYNANLVDGDEPERVQGVRASANIFEILGVQPLIGRTLFAADDRNGAAPVAMISHRLWSRRYQSDPRIVGRSVVLNGEDRTIVGVLPPDFALPNLDTDVLVPLQPDSDPRRTVRASVNFLRFVGRVKPGVTAEQAHAELDAIRQNLRRRFPETYAGKIGVELVPLSDEIVGNSRPMLITIFGAVGALLLIACANLASLSLARAAARQRELAVRSALGAARGQLIRLLLSESAVLSIAGGVLGILIAYWGSDALARFVPADLPRIERVTIDAGVLLFTSVVVLLVTIICGLAPAWLLSRTDLRNSLIVAGRGQAGGMSQARLRRWLVAGQVGLALVLLASAGLFVRSFARLTNEHPGFDARGLLTVRLSLPQEGYPDRAAFIAYCDKLLPRIAALPGVEHAGMISLLPLTRAQSSIVFTVADRPATRDEKPAASYRIITPGYLAAMRIPLVSGRNFTEEDSAERPPVVLISAPLAQKFFSDRSPIGQRLLIDDLDGPPHPVEVIGVIGAVKQERLEAQPGFDIYLPLTQVPNEGVPWLRTNSFWVVRTSIQPLALEGAVRNQIRNVDSTVPANNVRTMEQVMTSALAARRFSLVLVSLFAISALLLAAAGLYAVIAYGIAQRTREIGLRLALGATRPGIFGMILSEGLRLVTAGVALGAITTVALLKLITTQLYGVSAYDPLSFAIVTVVLSGVSLAACGIAARRAIRLDPAIALRAE
jgi:putative ABC transport system permease protein